MEFQGHHLRLITMERVAPGAAVSVEHGDAMFLGEVVRCIEDSSGQRLDIRVEQVLNGLMTLMALRARLLDEAPRPVAAGERR